MLGYQQRLAELLEASVPELLEVVLHRPHSSG